MVHSNGSVMHTNTQACFLYFFYMSLFNSKIIYLFYVAGHFTQCLYIHTICTTVFVTFSIEIMCPDLENPANGAVMVNGVNPGDTATYTCISGYELVGADTLTCGTDGMWSPEPPVCTRELSHK